MDESFMKFLNKAGKFSDKEALLLQQEIQYRDLKKETYLLKEGDTCSSLYFVILGSFYQYKTDSDLNTNVIDLRITNDWIIENKSFTSRKPSEYTIKAFTDSTVIELSIHSIHKLIAISPSFFQIGKVLEEATARVAFFDNNNTPDEKYEYILKNKPQLLQEFPQKIIASYLKITPETLSRVRKRIQ